MISHQTPAPSPLITQPPTPLLLQISRTAFCLNPAKTVSFPHDPASPDLPGSVWITSLQLPAQATRARNVFECSVTNAGESHPPSKDWPSAAEPPGSAEPDTGGCWGLPEKCQSYSEAGMGEELGEGIAGSESEGPGVRPGLRFGGQGERGAASKEGGTPMGQAEEEEDSTT
ncbi:hypothetical protein E4T56_gene5559 [Termitomyces sp. T112]|nr:hypothetical protein E4T56_gene5559 [Termitomyces sp. T112]